MQVSENKLSKKEKKKNQNTFSKLKKVTHISPLES